MLLLVLTLSSYCRRFAQGTNSAIKGEAATGASAASGTGNNAAAEAAGSHEALSSSAASALQGMGLSRQRSGLLQKVRQMRMSTAGDEPPALPSPVSATVTPSTPQPDEEVSLFVDSLEIEERFRKIVLDAFTREGVSLHILRTCMEKDDLKDIGLPIGPRSLIWRAIQELRET